jgi:hypothetical protein
VEVSGQLRVSVALGYGLDDRMIRVPFPEGAGNFCFRHRVQTGSGAHTASYQMGTGGKAAGVHLHLVQRSGMCEAVPPPPVRLHGIVLS